MEELFNIKGSVAIVTGAATGLGRLFARTLAAAGAKVVCADVDVNLLEKTVSDIKSAGQDALALKADVSLPEDVRKMVHKTVSEYGSLDVAINNAGIITAPCRFHEIKYEDWNRLMAIDLTGVFLCMQQELRAMMDGRKGVIVNIASVAGLRGVSPEHKPRANYVAAKHGVIGLTKQAALEYATHNIRVNAIAPGWFSGTDLNRERLQNKTESEMALEKKRNAFVPMERKGTLDELKGLILYLTSDASSYVSGQVFAIDGGVTAR
jgi:gluconate 5-dehydrogenase